MEIFYDNKDKEFHDMKLGKMSVDELVTKFLSLLHYVPYIKEENAKIQWFLSGFVEAYRNKIEFDNSKTMDGTIRKEKLCYT